MELTPGTLYMISPPNCPDHGKMQLSPSLDAFTCAGYDGEGCPRTAPAEMTELGTVNGIEMTWPR